jgi:hypothetical protein
MTALNPLYWRARGTAPAVPRAPRKKAPAMTPITARYTGSPRDFDFFIGRWRTRNRRLVGRLEGSTTWEEFESLSEAWPVLGGLGNMDTFEAPDWRPGFMGMTLRIFNSRTRQWSIYWVDNASSELQPPVVGGFDGDVGIFEGPDTLRGQPISVRFTWTRINDREARWEQAFSADAGASWETNWTMELAREDALAALTV